MTKSNITNKDKALVRDYLKSYETGSIDKVMSFVYKDHIHHPPEGSALNFDERKREDEYFLAAFSKIKVKIDKQTVEGKKIITQVTMNAVHSRSFNGVEETYKNVCIPFKDTVTIHNGKIFEEWAEFDLENIIKQIS